jgi:hypothetical protein
MFRTEVSRLATVDRRLPKMFSLESLRTPLPVYLRVGLEYGVRGNIWERV